MKMLSWIGQFVSWVGLLALFGVIFGGSMFALITVLNRGQDGPADVGSLYAQTTDPSLPELTADDFDVRKAVAFLDGRARAREVTQTAASTVPVSNQSPETVRLVTTSAAVATQNQAHVGGTAVNLRAGPSKNSPRLVTLQPGETVQIVGMNGGWLRVVTLSGETGWVSARYVNGAGPGALTALSIVSSPQWSNGETELSEEDALAYSEPTFSNRSTGFMLVDDENDFRRQRKEAESVPLDTPDGSPFWSYD